MTTAQTEARAVDVLAEEMRAGLEGVTPGPWYQTGAPWFRSGDGVLAGSPDGNIAYIIADCDNFAAPRDEYDGPFPLGDQERDAAHIARCSPENIRALLDDRATLTQENAELRAELAALKKQVEELTAERDAATISGWKAAIDCASYAAANTYGPRVDPAAVAKARDDLVQELLTASPADYLDCCWKDAQDAIRAEAEVAALRKALKEIAEGRGVCEKCGTLASGEGAGYTDCGCTYPTWAPLNPSAHARSALASTRETSDAG